jgi:plasmid stabilization system protein ParE
MTEPRVVLSRRAAEDLFEIEAYINQGDGELRARQVVERIMRTLARLAFMPGAGRIRADLERSPYTFVTQSWRVFYRPTRELDGIVVIRVIDTRRDIDSIMRKKRNSRRPKK